MSSRTWFSMSRSLSVLVSSSSLSARVLLPWSMCAIMQKFRMFFISIFKGKDNLNFTYICTI